MFNHFRFTMAWVHTWFGLVLGFVLMVCFFFGALSVFDREIDRWANPETRFEPQPMPSFDVILKPVFEALGPHPADMAATAQRVIGELPKAESLPMQSLYAYTTHRDPILKIGGEFAIPNKPKSAFDDHIHVHGWANIDPRNGEVLREDALNIGSDWFYPLHYSLHLNWNYLGIFIVGFAALMMMAALVTGVIIHRKLFREFFTFRPWKRTQRSALDLHNLTGVLALPFHFFFAFSGLVIFAGFYYLPLSSTLLKPLHDQFEVIEAERTGLPHEPAGVAAPLASVDAMVVEAKRRWADRDMAGEVGYLYINHVRDVNGYVSIYRAGSDRVALVGEGIHFKASSGELLREDPPKTVVFKIDEFLTGLHLQHFEHWLLRWLYLLGGLMGCVCIATGFIYFVEKRKQLYARTGSPAGRIVDALAVTTVTGMLIATVGMLLANRMLPSLMLGKGEWEKGIFWFLWILSFVHAVWRSTSFSQARQNPAWYEQCWLLVVLSVATVLLNWVTTGDHLVKTILTDPYWAVAGVDLSLLGSALIAFLSARKLVGPVSESESPVQPVTNV